MCQSLKGLSWKQMMNSHVVLDRELTWKNWNSQVQH
uniref:Uncharacterized protein n=1 Tax=Rhizophora mucronata TaxID=61149 RepID=A0A2P2PNT5_RHIMU